MSCEVFEDVNSSDHVNIITHYFLNTSSELKPTFIRNLRKVVNGTIMTVYIDYNTEKTDLTINRTHGNT